MENILKTVKYEKLKKKQVVHRNSPVWQTV